MSQTASKKYKGGDSFLPGDIVTGSFLDTFNTGGSDFTRTISYYKLGNFYFGFSFYNTNGGGGSPLGIAVVESGSANDNADRIASKIGVTVNTVYNITTIVSASLNTGAVWKWSTGAARWTDDGTAPGSILFAFLAN
jgi:hypothetical protein